MGVVYVVASSRARRRFGRVGETRLRASLFSHISPPYPPNAHRYDDAQGEATSAMTKPAPLALRREERVYRRLPDTHRCDDVQGEATSGPLPTLLPA